MKNPNATLLFDLNETLLHQIRSERSHIASTYAALSVWHWEITYEQFEEAWTAVHRMDAMTFAEGRALLSKGDLSGARVKLREPWYRDNIARMVKFLKIPPSERWIEKITWAFQDSWVGGLTEIAPGCLAVLKKLRDAGIQTGLVTNFQQADIIPDILDQFGLSRIFNVVTISSEFGVRKPHPDLFNKAVNELGLDPKKDKIFYVGDNIEDDVDGAQYADLCPILVDNTDQYQGKFPSIPHIKTISELPGLL